MKKRLFLHVGMPKCATTTVQDYLAGQAGALAARGIHYEFHPAERTGDQGNAAQLAFAMIEQDGPRIAALLDFFLRHAEGDVILSSEYLFGVARGGVTRDVLDRIRRQGFEVGAICFLRRQDLWIESDYKQHVKSRADWREGLDALLQRRIDRQVLNYNWMLTNWAGCVGRDNIVTVPLHPGQAPDYPVRAVLAAMGCADMLPEGAAAPVPRNVSPPTGLIEPARHLKKTMLDQEMALPVVTRQLTRFFDRAPRLLEVPPRRFLMPLAARRRLLQRFANANEALARNFLDGAAGFGAEPENDPASEAPLGAEAAALLAAWYLEGRPGLRAAGRAWRQLSALRRGLTGRGVRN